ncbi:MAG: 4Fe-4S binding protein [Bacteroidetes bacterium]|nr:4Fe-4S binding protein [Bacteroidota bacterium]
MIKKLTWILLLLILVMQGSSSLGRQRFPKPEFESSYVQPETMQPSSRAEWLAGLDVIILTVSLFAISWLVIKKRSRMGVFWMSLFSLLYFGFYRQGCVCSIGAIQNVSLALFHPAYVLPFSVLAFFILPLVFTVFHGRIFCAGVCPFGAMQDLVAFQPQKLGERMNNVLGLLPYLYLGLAVLFAATGTDFIICRYDPFVGIFRLNAPFGMFVFSGLLLACGVFIARPYCRFLCPYGVLLNWISRFSGKHLTITPNKCIQCRLCEESCPYGAIELPQTSRNPEEKRITIRKFILLCLLIPLMVISGGYIGSTLSSTLAGVNPKIQLARELLDTKKKKDQPETFEMQAFKQSGKTSGQLFTEARSVLSQFYKGGWYLGGFLGLVFGLMIAGRMKNRYQPDYVPNKGNCFSCARCVDYCPIKS